MKHILPLISAILIPFTLAKSVTLVEDGQSRALIVTAAQPTRAARQGAEILSAQLEIISGAKVDAVGEDALQELSIKDALISARYGDFSPLSFILVGESKLAEQLGMGASGLGPSGIKIKTLGNSLILLGADDKTPKGPDGSRYAVTTFLEDNLGCRMLWPGELGFIVPKNKNIKVSDLDFSFTPPILQRGIRNAGYNRTRSKEGLDYLGLPKKVFMDKVEVTHGGSPELPNWFEWQRLGGSMQIRAGHAFGFMWAKNHKQHPEWFAMQPNGSRDLSKLRPERSRLCKSNPELVEYIANYKINEMRELGLNKASLCPNDGGPGTFCMCPECKKLDPPDGRPITLTDSTAQPRRRFEYVSLTDRMLWFWNGVAEKVVREIPDAQLGVYSYSAYKAPPLREKVHPNLVVGFVGGYYGNEKERELVLADWDAWSKIAKTLYWRPNLLLLARREGVPGLFPHKLSADLRRFVDSGTLAGTDFDSCQHNWASEGLNYYVLSRMLWDPAQDVDDVIDDYCRSGFGEAWRIVRAYFDRIEELTDNIAENAAPITSAYTPDVVESLTAMLGAAYNADNDPVVRRRVAFLQSTHSFAELQYRTHKFERENPRAGLSAESRQQILELQREKWELMRRLFTEQPLAINMAVVAWGGEGKFRKYGWHGATKGPIKAQVEADRDGQLVLPNR